MTEPPFVVEPQRRVPVAAEVDVAVAGSGIAGMFAALRCGRAGLRTLLIDRLGALGGNMGPGMVVGGNFAGEADVTLIGGLHGIPRELLERVEARVNPIGVDAQPARFNYAEDVLLVSAVATEMMAEAGVARFDDVLFVNVHEGRPPHAGAVEGCDVPYRCLLPRGVDNLLVVGRGAAYVRRGHDPTGMRARPLVMVLGQAAGVAATLAIESNTTVKGVERRELQRLLLTDGFHLGHADRLRELGLA